jgi:alpha-galactosidase
LSAFVFANVIALTVSTAAGAATAVRVGSASISTDPESATWTIASSGAALTLVIDPARDFEVVRLSSPRKIWATGGQTDTVVKIGSQTIGFGNRAAGFRYADVTASVHGSTVQLDVVFDLSTSRLRVTRHYAATSGSPIFETWTTFAPQGTTVSIADLNAFRLMVSPGTVHWVTGLQAGSPPGFNQRERTLGAGERMSIGAEGRSSEQSLPSFAINADTETFVGGIMWSGAWSFTATRSTNGLELSVGLAPMSTLISSPTDGPHAFFGAARGDASSAGSFLSAFVSGLRGGRGFDPLVTYNTWFAYGTHVDESSMLLEIDGAAALGAELFVLDAGWLAGAARPDPADFSGGLGTWQADPSRFPNGLRVLTDRAHERGMKFGLWVEPERIALSTVNQRGLAQEPWLAKVGGKYASDNTAQICFGSPAARQWVFDQIVRLIDSVRPDYLKWDNNFWINCDRGGHGHGTSDGNFAHVTGLYEVLAELRSRYPDLLIENVSGGGNRLDFGMLRYTDVAWMDDRSVPSVHVRHNIEGLSAAFPPAYLLSFVMDYRDESLHSASDMPLYFRSRMTGALGLCFRTGEFDESDLVQMTSQIDTYKAIRRNLRLAAGALLTPQADSIRGPAWDVLQTIPPGNRDWIIIGAFQWDEAETEITVRPVALRPLAIYEVWSVDTGLLGSGTGADLMETGIDIIASPRSAAHLLLIKPVRRPD